MSLGTLLLVGAVSLLLWNQSENRKAEERSEKSLYQIVEKTENVEKEENGNPYEESMPEKEIDGYKYIGYLTIPALNIQLPVMSEWDYAKLRIAPCRYYGSTVTDDLVIAAHNYKSHFGRTGELSVGDKVAFTNMNGITKEYEVMEVNVLKPTDVESMTNGEFDLRLFTCTYGGKSRLTIGCSEIVW